MDERKKRMMNSVLKKETITRKPIGKLRLRELRKLAEGYKGEVHKNIRILWRK